MCNLYSMTKSQAAIRELTRAMRDTTGNLPPMPGIFPDYMAPIVRTGPDGAREFVMARWGMPSSQKALLDAAQKRAQKLEAKGKAVDFKELLRMEPDSGATNIRNTKSKHWQRWLSVENRCLVPSTSFSEFNKAHGGPTNLKTSAAEDSAPLGGGGQLRRPEVAQVICATQLGSSATRIGPGGTVASLAVYSPGLRRDASVSYQT
jgi:putative SOS response-associated peptidase YedK